MIQIIPAIGPQKEFDSIKRRVELVVDLVDWIHIDILDNTMIKNDTYNNFEAFRLFADRVNMEAHLMVSDPAKYVEPLIKNGFKRLIAHVEGFSARDFLHECRVRDIESGLALDGPSNLELVEPFLDTIDCVLIMTIKAGFSGQGFQKEQLPKIRQIHEEYPDLPIEVDGGIDKESAPLVLEKGATRLAVTSYLFKQNLERLEEAMADLKSAV